MSAQDKRRLWMKWLKEFSLREYRAVLFWTAIGALCAGALRLIFNDHAFDAFLLQRYTPEKLAFDDPKRYFPYGLSAALSVAGIALALIVTLMRRGLRSWWFGVTSGLSFLTFLTTVTCLSMTAYSFTFRLLAYLTSIVISFAAGLALHCRAEIEGARLLSEEDLKVSLETKQMAGSLISESDEPIQNWSEDTLDRASVVETLSIKLLISKVPVIALFGDFGSGKSSILNLLREHISHRAIVVSFSTWLPGSQETLTSYLLADIANECQKYYLVPGLRKGTRRIANALSESVPFLKGYSQLLPSTTQKDDIENLRRSLARLPKRVIVLLDELDRMEKDELLPLLKVVRGISSLPNLSFVCAAERTTLTRTVCSDNSDESNLYFEKFFPWSQPIPKSDSASLQATGIERVTAAFQRRSWFENDTDMEDFRKRLTTLWPAHIAPFCRNLRSIGLLSNDIAIAAAALRQEVDPIDLVLIELLRRFKPAVHEIVSRNALALTGGESWVRGGAYHSDDEIKRVKKTLNDDLASAAGSPEQLFQVKELLGELFPKFAKEEKLSGGLRRQSDEGDPHKKIADAGMFSAYFRYDLPTEMYSSVELQALRKSTQSAISNAEKEKLFLDELRSMERGSLKRDDFLSKIAAATKIVPINVADAWTKAAVIAARELSYDLMTAFGEAGHVIRMVIRTATRLQKPERLEFLRDLIDTTTDDTLAFRILTQLTRGEKHDFDLDTSFAELYPAFVARMRLLYGSDVDPDLVDFTTSDAGSFNLWGSNDLAKFGVTPDPVDRAMAHDFWRRYIGYDRRRLLFAFDRFFLQDSVYQGPVDPWVETKLDIATIRRLYDELPAIPNMDDAERKADRKLLRYLRGDFANGIDIGQLERDEPDESHDDGGGG